VTPIEKGGRLDGVLKQMADEGLITLPTKTGPMPRFEPARITGKPISQTIIDGRRERGESRMEYAYFDPSALIQRYVHEPGRREIVGMLRTHHCVVSAAVP